MQIYPNSMALVLLQADYARQIAAVRMELNAECSFTTRLRIALASSEVRPNDTHTVRAS